MKEWLLIITARKIGYQTSVVKYNYNEASALYYKNQNNPSTTYLQPITILLTVEQANPTETNEKDSLNYDTSNEIEN